MQSSDRRFMYAAPLVLQKIGYCFFFILYKLFVSIDIRGREYLQGLSGPVIIAANHTSELDVTAIPLILPWFSKLFPLYFVSNPTEKFKTFGWRSYLYGGAFFNMLGGYAIHSGHRDYAISLEDHLALLRQGKTVCIFPEGKRTRDGKLNPGRGGIGYMVNATGATVVPVSIDTFFHLSAWEFFTRQRKVMLTVSKPLAREDVLPPGLSEPTVEDFRATSQAILDRIGENLG